MRQILVCGTESRPKAAMGKRPECERYDEPRRRVTLQIRKVVRSVRIRFIGPGDANPVIGELAMRPWHQDFRHVAGHTVPFAGWTMTGCRYVGAMTGYALCIIGIHVALDHLVRVMTRDATDATVRRVKAAAAFQAISLEANVLNTVKIQRLFLR